MISASAPAASGVVLFVRPPEGRREGPPPLPYSHSPTFTRGAAHMCAKGAAPPAKERRRSEAALDHASRAPRTPPQVGPGAKYASITARTASSRCSRTMNCGTRTSRHPSLAASASLRSSRAAAFRDE